MAIPLLAAGLAAAAAGLGFWGQERSNAANARSAKEQMEFQERLSNTSWQRAVKDMQGAGLNPMLAYSQGGAGTPGGASSQSANSAAAAAQNIANLSLTGKQIENMDAQTRQTQSDTALKNLDWTMRNMERGNLQRTQEWMQFVDKDGKPVYGDEGKKTGAMPYAIYLMQQQAITQLRQANSASAASEASANLMQLDTARAKRESDMYKGAAGKFIPYLNSAGQAAKTLNDFRSLIQR